jgi:outer membrane protein TolC
MMLNNNTKKEAGSCWVRLFAASPRATTRIATPLRAFRYYPCRSFVISLLLLAAVQTNAQVITLDSLLGLIDTKNPMLQVYDNKVKALNEYASGATSWMAPMVGAGTFMTPYPNQTVMHENEKGALMFSVEQQIPNPAKVKANRKYLESRAGIEERSRAIQYNTFRALAKNYYYQWLVAERKLNVIEENKRSIELMLKLAHIRYPYNQASLGSIYKIEARLGEIQNVRWMAQSIIDDKKFKLKSLINIPMSDSIRVDTATRIVFIPTQFPSDTATLSTVRSDIQQLDKTVEVMQLNQRLQRSQARPDFKVRFDHMQPVGDMPTQFTAMAMVSIPIAPWSSKMYKAEVKGMQYDIEAMKKNREAILIETRGMLMGMSNQLIRMKQQLENYQNRIIPALQHNYKILMIAYEENREQLPQVIDGWEALNMTQLEYLDKLEEYFMMIVSYEKEVEQ